MIRFIFFISQFAIATAYADGLGTVDQVVKENCPDCAEFIEDQKITDKDRIKSLFESGRSAKDAGLELMKDSAESSKKTFEFLREKASQ